MQNKALAMKRKRSGFLANKQTSVFKQIPRKVLYMSVLICLRPNKNGVHTKAYYAQLSYAKKCMQIDKTVQNFWVDMAWGWHGQLYYYGQK